jgi:hypothetical protein
MSLFDDVLGEENASAEGPYGQQEGYAGVLFCPSACNGHLDDEEAESLFLILSQKKLYQRSSQLQFGATFDRLMGQLKRGGPEELLEKC